MQHAVIMAGGSGVRFWPLSRKNRPKQFLPLTGGTSLLRSTFERIRPVVPPECIWVVTASRHARRVRRELPELGPGRVLKEPRARNTAPAIYRAALAIGRRDPAATMLVTPADAWIPKPEPYRRALVSALRVAEAEDRLVLVGVRPTRPETGYGYIEPGTSLATRGARAVRRFIEKPAPRRAERLFRSGDHLWNAGIFAWRQDLFAEAVGRFLPVLKRAFAPIEGGRVTDTRLEQAYARAPTISVDEGVLERAGNLAVVPARFPWDDLGSWRALEKLGSRGAFARGSVVSVDSRGVIAWAEGGTVATIGVADLVVVHTPDATLVMAKDRAQDVREVVTRLTRRRDGTKLVEGKP